MVVDEKMICFILWVCIVLSNVIILLVLLLKYFSGLFIDFGMIEKVVKCMIVLMFLVLKMWFKKFVFCKLFW